MTRPHKSIITSVDLHQHGWDRISSTVDLEIGNGGKFLMDYLNQGREIIVNLHIHDCIYKRIARSIKSDILPENSEALKQMGIISTLSVVD